MVENLRRILSFVLAEFAGVFSCLGKGGGGGLVSEYFRQRQGFAFLSKRLTQKGLQKSLEGVIDISLYGKNTGNSDWLKLKIRPGWGI